MKAVTYYIFLLFVAFSFFNCSDDDSPEEDNLIGQWQLVEYSVGLAVDLNNDGLESVNLLDEVDCDFSERILIDEASYWELSIEHDLEIVAKQSLPTSAIVLDIGCSDGVISGVGQLSAQARENYLVNGTTLTRNFTDGLRVYNDDFSEVINYLTITKIYQKQ